MFNLFLKTFGKPGGCNTLKMVNPDFFLFIFSLFNQKLNNFTKK